MSICTMTTYIYTTTSTETRVADVDAVEELCSEYSFTVEPIIEGEYFEFFAEEKPNAAFDVYETAEHRQSVAEEFFSRLSEYLVDEFEVKCLEVGGNGEPAAWKWVVTPAGEVEEIPL